MNSRVISAAGILFGLLASLSMAAMTVFVHYSKEKYTLGEVVFSRSLFMMLATLPFAYPYLHILFQKSSKGLWVRSVIAGIAMITYIKTLQLGHVALANSLAALTQVLVPMLAYIFLKEKFQRMQIIGILIIISSVLFIQLAGITEPVPTVWAIGLLSCVFASISFVMLRKIAQRFPLSLIIFSVAFLSLCFSLTLEFKQNVFSHSFYSPALLAICFSALSMQFFMTLSFRTLPAGQAVVLSESFIIFSGLFSSIYSNTYMPKSEWIPYILIIVGTSLVQLTRKT